jgi:hypothetical protein
LNWFVLFRIFKHFLFIDRSILFLIQLAAKNRKILKKFLDKKSIFYKIKNLLFFCAIKISKKFRKDYKLHFKEGYWKKKLDSCILFICFIFKKSEFITISNPLGIWPEFFQNIICLLDSLKKYRKMIFESNLHTKFFNLNSTKLNLLFLTNSYVKLRNFT